jgi:DNA-binding response OmpR family regulator
MAKKILVIEDEKATREAITEFLRWKQFDVIQAENSQQGIEKAIREEPHLIVCDTMMPAGEGYQVLEKLRNTPETSLVPFIFLTAKGEEEPSHEEMVSGVDAHLVKPFTNQELLQAIYSKLQKQSLFREKFSSEFKELESLRNKIADFQQRKRLEDTLLEKIVEDLRSNLAKMNLASYLLRQDIKENRKVLYVEILREECDEQIKLLEKMSELRALLTPDNLKILQRYNLLGNFTKK